MPDYYQTFNRNYDAALGRFVGVDPIAESAESMTSYQYAGNNPIMFNDPLGDLIKYIPTQAPLTQAPQIVSNLTPSTGPLDGSWQDGANFGGGDGSGDYSAFWSAVESDVNSYINTNGADINVTLNAGAVSFLYNQYNANGDDGSITNQMYNNDAYQSYGTGDDGSTNATANITASTSNSGGENGTQYFVSGPQLQSYVESANEGGWPFTAKSDPKSWIFRTDKTNENVQSAGVTGIEFSRHDIRYNISSDVLTIVAIHIRLPTLYFEYPRITSIFGITNEVIDASWAALVMARATDRAINQLTDWVDGQENPTEWGTKIQFMKYLEGQVLKDFGRVTSVQNYSPVIVTPYKTL